MMELINFEGLNCYYNSVISIAHYYGVPYINSFAKLWSEKDFTYCSCDDTFISKTMFDLLRLNGITTITLNCEKTENTKLILNQIDPLELFIVKMDAYDIPWNLSYMIYHSPHYFIVKKKSTKSFHCFDPTYSCRHQMESNFILDHCCEIVRISIEDSVIQNTFDPLFFVKQEAKSIVDTHVKSCRDELMSYASYMRKEDWSLETLAKYVNCMLSNRQLYKRFFYTTMEQNGYKQRCLFDLDFFNQWNAVKNGLMKASFLNNNSSILVAVRSRFSKLIKKEICIAENILETIK